jgi:2-keto-4-pentenoate hydratase
MGDSVIDEFIAARDEPRAHRPPSAERRLEVREAYGLQDRLRAALVARGERVAGWKVGLTTRASQQANEVEEPVSAFLLASGVFLSGAEVPAGRFVSPGVEAEVALVMRRELAGPGVTATQALLAVEGALPALELIDFRYDGKYVGTDVIAEGVFASAIVLGAALQPIAGVDLALEGLVYEHNGSIAGTATAAEVMGNPLNSLAWLANHLGGRGLGVRAGDVVMTGSVSRVLRPTGGDILRAAYTRLGTASVRLA